VRLAGGFVHPIQDAHVPGTAVGLSVVAIRFRTMYRR
jgi:hypothetical protein